MLFSATELSVWHNSKHSISSLQELPLLTVSNKGQNGAERVNTGLHDLFTQASPWRFIAGLSHFDHPPHWRFALEECCIYDICLVFVRRDTHIANGC
jgi:hypothetical protein